MVYRRTVRSDMARAAARERILEAARTLFERDGYDATTMQDIVAAAGTSIGNAYFYFANKERLLAELLTTRSHQNWDEVDAAVESIPPGPARVGAIIYWNVTGVLGPDRGLARLMLHTDQRVGGIAIMREISVARWRPHLAASFPEAEAVVLTFAATAIFGANRAVVERVLLGGLNAEPAVLARELVRWALRGLGASEAQIDATLRSARRRVSAPIASV